MAPLQAPLTLQSEQARPNELIVVGSTNCCAPMYPNLSSESEALDQAGNVKLSEFLVRAKSKTYASGGEEREIVLGDGSKEFAYEEGMFQYRDRYLGFNPFVGEEVVWRNRELIWAMNYYGRITPRVPANIVYRFLREALRRVKNDRPFRGPPIFTEGTLVYLNESTGWISYFTGAERILASGREIYKLFYHGGRIKSD